MTGNLCDCGQPSPDATLCRGCQRRLELLLGDVPATVADLETTIARIRSASVGGSRSAETPVPWDERAAKVRDHLHGTLVAWVRLVRDENTRAPEWPQDRTSALAGWLLGQIRWLRLHEAATQALDEIAAAVRDARWVVDNPPDREFVGTCDAVHQGQRCWDQLYAVRGADEVTCRTCGTGHAVDERRKATRIAVEDFLAQASEITRAVLWCGEYVRKQQISTWAINGRLEVRAHRGEHALYRIGDVLDLLRDTRSVVAS